MNKKAKKKLFKLHVHVQSIQKLFMQCDRSEEQTTNPHMQVQKNQYKNAFNKNSCLNQVSLPFTTVENDQCLT
jgi:hypothetical protein